MKKLILALTVLLTIFGINVYASTSGALSDTTYTAMLRDYFGNSYEAPDTARLNRENINPANGALTITETDLSLPGKKRT